MSEAMAQNHFQTLGQIARQCIAHLDRRPQFSRTPREHGREVLSGVPAAREKQCNPLSLSRRNNPGSKYSLASRGIGCIQAQDPHSRVVVVQHFALCRLPNEFFQRGLNPIRGFLQIPHWVEAGNGISSFSCSTSKR
jgi:hypothetical protein